MICSLPTARALATTCFMSQGARNWPFLMLTGLPARHRLDEIGLAAQEGRRLQHVDHRRDLVERRVFVHVGQHRHAELRASLRTGCAGLRRCPARGSSVARNGWPCRRGLEDERNAELAGDFLAACRRCRAASCSLSMTQGPAIRKNGVEADFEIQQLHAATSRGCRLRWCARAAARNRLNSG
jgi:hypothetical protein